MAVMNVTFLSYSLQRYVDFKVILPVEDTKTMQSNPKNKPIKFKTVYLLHGHSGACGDWLYGSRIFKIARDRNIAIVMPSGENSFYVDHNESGVLYGSYIGKELVEVTRRMFPLSEKREDTLIGGLSMGGFGSLLVGSRYAETFGGIISLSSGFIINDVVHMLDSDRLLEKPRSYFESIFGDVTRIKGSEKDPLAMAIQAHEKGILPPIYFACGRQDYVFQYNVDMKNELQNAGIDIHWVEDQGEHEWTFWDPYIEIAIDWCFDNVAK